MIAWYIFVWFLAYFLPASLALVTLYFFPHRSSMSGALVIHVALGVSIILSQYFIHLEHQYFPWHIYLYSVIFLILVFIITPFLVGSFGFFYIFSSLIQELTILSMAYYLIPHLNFSVVVLLIVPIYTLAHLMNLQHWRFRTFITLLWGVLSIVLFNLQADIILNVALHAIFGVILIHRGLLYVYSDFPIIRSHKV